MEEINLRIKMVFEESGLNQEEFAKSVEISKSAFQKILYGTNHPSNQTVVMICQKYNYRREWLESGIEPKKNPDDEFETLVRQIWPAASSRVIDFLKNVNDVPGGMDALIDTLENLTMFVNKKPEA